MSHELLPEEVSEDEDQAWQIHAGFVTPDRIIACTKDADGEYRHWFYDMSWEEVRGLVKYDREIDEHILGLGDGTWLTADEEGLQRWAVDG